MSFILQPWQLFFAVLSGWTNRRQQQIIEFQNSQIKILLQKLGKKRILPTDDHRRLLAVKGKILARNALREPGAMLHACVGMFWVTRLRWPFRMTAGELRMATQA